MLIANAKNKSEKETPVQNLLHLNSGLRLQIRQIWIRLITGKCCKRMCSKYSW